MSRASNLAGFSTSLSTTIDLNAGIITATRFFGDGSGLTGVASTDNIQTSTPANFLNNVTIGGNLVVNGTQTIINTQTLDVADKTVGVASTSTKTALTQDGGGLVIYGPTDVELTYSRDKVAVGLNTNFSVTGVVTASKVSANEFVGSGDKLIFSPTITSFSPIDGATDVSLATTISITFDQPIYAGVGTITLRNSSGIGTIIQSIGINSTSQVSFSNQTLTITPSPILPPNVDVYVVLPAGAIKNAVGGIGAALSSYNFTTVNFVFSSINPPNGATNVGIGTSISLTFTTPPSRGTGTIELRSGSVNGTLVESFNAATSPRISVVSNTWFLAPTSPLGFTTSIHTIIPSSAIPGFAGLNTTGASSHSFTTRGLQLGDAFGGGYLICQSGGTRWIVAPSTSEVSRTWVAQSDSNTRAQQVSGCTGWFVPSCAQLQNPGFSCRTYWDSYANAFYWSSTERNGPNALAVSMVDGNQGPFGVHGGNKYDVNRIRSFRCVSY